MIKHVATVVVLASVALTSQAQTASNLDLVLNPKQSPAQANQAEVGYARAQVLREAAVALGARAGLADRSREILAQLDARAAELDKLYPFNHLVIGPGVLPPVISVSRGVVALEDEVLRTADGVYQIHEPARFAMPTPTWRNWLYLGLDGATVAVPSLGGNGPNNPAEKKLWEQLVREGYEAGRRQAQEAFDLNFRRLARTHEGMALYYDLWQRGMVSAPVIASATEVVVREDDRTISVGNTLHRITQQPDFQPHQAWMPLE